MALDNTDQQKGASEKSKQKKTSLTVVFAT